MTPSSSPSGPGDRPFVIYTLQRTGGTNFTNRLSRRSSWTLTRPHEPFNTARIYEHVTRAWTETGDRAALDAAMAEICAGLESMKHCVEVVPAEITEALIDAAVAADYRHLFLYRKDPVSRILSTEYARRTTIWGPRHVEKVAGDARAFERPIDAAALLEREAMCIGRLNDGWHRLRAAGAAPVAIAYEDLYGPDREGARAALDRVLAALDLRRGEDEDARLLDELRGRGDQQTRERYERFEGIGALREGAARLPELALRD